MPMRPPVFCSSSTCISRRLAVSKRTDRDAQGRPRAATHPRPCTYSFHLQSCGAAINRLLLASGYPSDIKRMGSAAHHPA